MAVGVGFGIMTNPAYEIPELWTHFYNMEPTGKPIWSFMFITVGLRRHFRLPRHPVAPDGPLHEVRAPGPHGVLRRHGL